MLHYNEKFAPDHRCKKYSLFFFDCDREDVEDEEIGNLLMATADKPREELAKLQTISVYEL